ncbi:MAG: UDP-glucose 4-epimerase GalE [Alphaproteobacteria bacterium]
MADPINPPPAAPVTVLVTGGAGYVGSHAAKALAAAGHRPVVFDTLSRGHARAVRWGPLVQGDIRDGAALDATLAEYRPAAVMHFAALALVGEGESDPATYWDVNVAGTLSLLNAMTRAGLTSLVFSSTCAVYGRPDVAAIAESTPLNPLNTYGRTKLAAECLMTSWHSLGLRHAALRYFNAAGADPTGLIGEAHTPETHLIPLTLDAAAGGAPLAVFGSDYDTPDGTAIRDYVHVDDLATAHVRALDHLLAGGDSLTLNLGSGTGHSVRQVIHAVEQVTGRPVPITAAPRRAGDPPRLVAAAEHAQRILGWTATGSSLTRIVETAWAWHNRRP